MKRLQPSLRRSTVTPHHPPGERRAEGGRFAPRRTSARGPRVSRRATVGVISPPARATLVGAWGPPPEASTRGTAPVATAPHPPAGAAALGALVAFPLAGLVDGAVTFARMPAASRSATLLAACLVHCAGVLSVLGLAVAAAQELFVHAAARRPLLRRLGAWLSAGGARWWRRDEAGALALSSALAGVAVAGLSLTAVAAHITDTFHSRGLMVTPLVFAALGAVVVAVAAAIVASWPLAALLRRAGRFASVGAVASTAGALALVPAARALLRHRDALGALDPPAVAITLALVAADLALVVTTLRAVAAPTAPRRRLVPRVALGATVACMALAVVPAFGLARRQFVLAALASESALSRKLIGPLQRVVDRDRDGHGVLFGGGDCDDRNPRAYPGAREVPDNGVDESCSGRDGSLRPATARAAAPLSAPTPGARPPSVLFVSIDAARPDRMSAYGYSRPTTPHLARFAQGAARFTNAYAVAPGSLRSFASTFTGRYPGEVAWGPGVDPRFPAVAEPNRTLAESLRAAGYATAAFTNTSYFSITPGFFQGFDVVREAPAFKDDAVPMVQSATEWIGRVRDRPFFAWVHLIDAHAPYGDHRWPADFGRTESDRYDGELARADLFASRLIEAADRIEARGAPVLVVVFSDHGEGFNEHGARYHFHDVHEEAIRVALLVRGPGIPPGDRHALTALFDLHATALDLANQPDDASAPSRSLVPVLLGRHGGAPPEWREDLYADAAEYGGAPPTSMALVTPPWKIAFSASQGAWELYNLALDPREQRNLFDDEPARANELRARLLDAGTGRW